MGLNAWLPTYLQKVRHFDLKSLGFFTSGPFVLMFFGEIAGGYVSDHIGRRAIVCFIGLFCAGALIYVVSLIADPYAAAAVMALSVGFWGVALPPLFALAAQIIPPSVAASGVGVYHGVGNLIGASVTFARGLDHRRPRQLQWGAHGAGPCRHRGRLHDVAPYTPLLRRNR
jgi:sugar phosphate permease